MSNNRPARNYISPTADRVGEDFVPRRTQDPVELERRRAMRRSGALILEQQEDGIRITEQMLGAITDPNDLAFAAQLLGGTLHSTAWYMFEKEHIPRMYRNLKLPVIAIDDETGQWRETREGYDAKAHASLLEAADLTHQLADVKRERRSNKDLSQRTARAVGNSGLSLVLLPLPGLSEGVTAVDYQLMVKESAMAMENKAIATTEKTGVIPSIAQISDPLSDLSVELQRNAPPSVSAAYRAVMDVYETIGR